MTLNDYRTEILFGEPVDNACFMKASEASVGVNVYFENGRFKVYATDGQGNGDYLCSADTEPGVELLVNEARRLFKQYGPGFSLFWNQHHSIW